jgi:5-methylcytosine-specific restriction endonuclease McrA
MGLPRKWDPMPSSIVVKDWAPPSARKARTGYWRKFRERLRLARGAFRCEACGTISDELEAHHVIPRTVRPDLEYVAANIRFLCPLCHHVAHKHDEPGRERSP